MHRVIAHENRLVAPLFNPFALESNRRIFRHVEEVRAPQIFITLGYAGVNALGLDGAARFLDVAWKDLLVS